MTRPDPGFARPAPARPAAGLARRAILAAALAAGPAVAQALLARPAAAAPRFPQADMKSLRSAHPFTATVERLANAIEAEGLVLVARASASEAAAGRGITIAGNAVLMAFRNDFALRMLGTSIAAGFEAPIRFYVTEGENSAWVHWRPPSAVFAPYLPEGGPGLAGLAAELDPLFARIAAQAVAPG